MTAVSFRVPEATKIAAFDVIKSYGLSPSQALNMFLSQIAKTHSIPVSLDYLTPNANTISAMEELDLGKAEHFDSLETFHKAMQG